jgi:NAD(P)-dependent dehydrogenase (short-subunit alcohol dehydrogenase family)
MNLKGKVILVTGGNAGIGLGFARGVARAGADVVIWGRRSDRNRAAAEELRKELGARVHPMTVDVADESSVTQAMSQAVETMGRIDGVIANAGIMTFQGSFLHMTTEAYHDLLGVNQHGVMYVTREAARHMKHRFDNGDPGGSLLLCASLSTFTGSVGMQHYNAAKGAVFALSKGIAVEGGRYGIRSNVVCPGYTASESVPDGGPESEWGRQTAERCPIPRIGTPDDFEGIGVYFMSDLSKYHTGDTVIIDGGWMANAGKSNLSATMEWP